MATTATNYYSLMSTAGSTGYAPALQFADPDKQYQLASSSVLGKIGRAHV